MKIKVDQYKVEQEIKTWNSDFCTVNRVLIETSIADHVWGYSWQVKVSSMSGITDRFKLILFKDVKHTCC